MNNIIPHVPYIYEKLLEYPVIILNSFAGSGKSLLMPGILAQKGYKIFVSMPTRISVTAAFSNARSIYPDINYGYSAEGDQRYNSSSQVVYLTFGSLKRKLMKYIDQNGQAKDVDFCDILIHDEVHNPGLDNTFNVMLSIYIKNSGVKMPKMILTTATLKASQLELFPDAFPIVIEGNPYPVTTIYSQRDYLKYEFKEDSNFFLDLIRTIILCVSTFKDNIIVFICGKGEIDATRKHLESNYADKIKAVKILELYSGADPVEQKIIEDKNYPGRLLILSSNIAESSVSIHRLNCVIDTMTEKILVTTETGSTKLETALISKASAIQRRARGNRFGPGTCYRMITERRFETLDPDLPDEILRLPMEKPLLEAINLKVDPYIFFVQVPREKIANAISSLIVFGCIEQTENGLLILEKGIFTGSIQMGLRLSSCLYDWYNNGYDIATGIITFCLIDSATYFFLPKPKRDESLDSYNKRTQEHVEKYFTGYFAHSDVETYLKLWNDYLDNNRGDYSNKEAIGRYASKNSINAQKLKDVTQNIKNTTATITQRTKETIEIKQVDIDRTVLRVLPILVANFSDRVMLSRAGKYVDLKNVTYKLDRSGVNKINLKRDYTVIPIVFLEVEDAVRVSVAIPYNLSKLFGI